MIPRLTPPKIVKTGSLPSYHQICSLQSETPLDEGEGSPSQFSDLSEDSSLSSLFDNLSSRAVFIGEQHHQPKVLSAQLQIIHQLFQKVQDSSKVHVVFEQWSLLDQPYLNEINRQESSTFDIGKNSNSEQDSTSEGFSASHYLNIVKLVRELGGTVWGGFPPRPWASMINKASVEEGGTSIYQEVQRLDQERYLSTPAESRQETITPPLSIENYKYVESISWPHRTYLKSMFNPDKRPLVPAEFNLHTSPPIEKKGFLAAQCVKDTFLAHTMANILEKDPKNFVIAIAGLGHCEWSFGAPERLKSMTSIDPFIIMTKPDDSTYWSSLPDAKQSSDLVSNPEWKRRQADAIAVYEWVD
jgi:uncharacterized iron-regulated protein